MNLTTPRHSYKPFQYPWAFELYKEQWSAHWTPEDIELAEDINDWKNKLSPEYVTMMSRILRFFTQADVDVARGYYEQIIPSYPAPEMRMMFGLFAAFEGIHIDSYSMLNDQLGLPEADYSAFMAIQAMADKHQYMEELSVDMGCARSRAKTLAVRGAFGEGLHLFGTFAILLNGQRCGVMKGMGQIVTYSIKDENLHVKGNVEVFHQEIKENPEIWDDSFKFEIYQACREMVALEDAFLDVAFAEGDLVHRDVVLTKDEVKLFIRHLANRRLLQLGLKENYLDLAENPLEWLDWILSNDELANFFETRVTEYAAGQTGGTWDDAWKALAPNSIIGQNLTAEI